MEHDQILQEISIIKKMIEKTRRETAESGHFFIFIGIIGAITTFVIGILELNRLNQYLLPVLAIMAVVSAITGYVTLSPKAGKEKVKTYAKTIFFNIWLACAIPGLIILLLPLAGVYPFHLVPALASLIMGIGLFTTGAVYEVRFIQWSSLAWWLGAGVLAYVESPFRFIVMIGIILIGFVLPGLVFNKHYKSRNAENGS